MKSEDIKLIATSVIFAAIFAVVVSLLLFGGAQKKISVPTIEKISSDFPDVKNDPNYSAIFNQNALDPTQTITIGGGSNNLPFSGGQ